MNRKIDLVSIILIAIGIISTFTSKALEEGNYNDFTVGFLMGMGVGLIIIGLIVIIVNNVNNQKSQDKFLDLWL